MSFVGLRLPAQQAGNFIFAKWFGLFYPRAVCPFLRKVARNLDIQSRPADDQQWKDARHQLDRRGTSAVQNLMSESERAAFDRVFIGIMGVDLGTGVDKTLYPDGFLGGPIPGPRQ